MYKVLNSAAGRAHPTMPSQPVPRTPSLVRQLALVYPGPRNGVTTV